ncbi:hypothetical protein [Qipengyuania oceanensis]|uniref:hypothetical protein n=1 Tax=Qipengyuania oceanensis TaxID=1463597 RepID=UPI001F30A082|nr:hypothetical protein [Qipengyuania oceanensis]
MTICRISIAIAALLAATHAAAAPGGPLRTLPRGHYDCALPGLAGNTPIVARDDQNFKVVNGSSYERDGKRGTYLHTGTRVVFTSGVLRGETFERVSQTMLRQRMADGTLGELRCVKRGS